MKAISFTGLARSGKDTAADHLVEKHAFQKLVMSEELAEELLKEGKEDTKINRAHKGKDLRKKFGQDIVAKRVFEKALQRSLEKVIFVGPRSVAEIEFFKKNIPGFKLIAIKAEKEERFERRSHKDGQTEEKFFERDRHDSTEFELEKVISMADTTIENNSTIDDFYKTIDALMQKV